MKDLVSSLTTLTLVFGFANLTVVDDWSKWWTVAGMFLAVLLIIISKINIRTAVISPPGKTIGQKNGMKKHYAEGERPSSAAG